MLKPVFQARTKRRAHIFKPRQRGFNLMELMIGIAIMAILISLAVPSMQWLIVSNRLTASANEMLTSIQSARMEAIRRNARVVICKSSNADAVAPTCDASAGQWQGWIVFVDNSTLPANGLLDAGEEIIRVGSMPGANTGLIPSPAIEASLVPQTITIRPDGIARESVTSSELLDARFSVCEDTTSVDQNAREITIAAGGRSGVGKVQSFGCAAPLDPP